MLVHEEKKNCCGCTACVNVCPKNCIDMQEDEYGFLYPVIDESKCVNCNLCRKTCAFVKRDDKEKSFDTLVYAVKNKNEEIHEKSSSGGVFIPLSDYVLDKNGVIYGAGYSDDFMIIHKRAVNASGRDEFVGSKYVQSNMNNCFSKVLEDLKADKFVLFTGTACQVHGLKAFLDNKKCNMDKLLTIDIVCHGVPSPKMWKDFLDRINKIGNLKSMTFTSKKIKNELKGLELTFDSRENVLTGFYWTSYGKLFLNNYILRDSCFNCQYTSPTNRYADITLGDFWGLDKVMPDFVDKKGVSLVIINSQKGQAWFNEIKDNFVLRESNVKDCLQPNLIEPSKMPENREKVLTMYKSKGYGYMVDKCFPISVKDKIKRCVRIITNKRSAKDL